MTIPTKQVKASPVHQAFRDDMIAVIKAHGDSLTAPEMLALASHLVGQLVALQDQNKMSPEMCMTLIAQNIEKGNAEAIDGLLGETKGEA